MDTLDRHQIFIDSPYLSLPSRALTLKHPLSLSRLKFSLLPQYFSSVYFTLDGKPLSDSATVPSPQIPLFSTLSLRLRARGGGGDGGATGAESRDCYLNMYAIKKPDKVDPNEQRLSKWSNCALSFEPLTPPCVLDFLGNVFNKQALVEALIAKKLPKEFGHIKGLKDMIPIELSAIPGLESTNGDTRFQCPVTGLEFNGKYKFFALKSCGHVLSAKALKEVKSSSCLVCHAAFTEADMIVINGSEEEVAALRERMGEEKAKLRAKKSKKAKNGEVGIGGEDGLSLDGEDGLSLDSSRLSRTKHGIDAKPVEKVTSKVEGNGKVASGEISVKGAINGSVKRFKAADMAPTNATKEVYASIFTSSKKSKFKETFTCRSLPLGRN